MISSNIVLVMMVLAVFLLAEALYYGARYRGEQKRLDLHRRLRSISDPSSRGLLRERRIAKSLWLQRVLEPLPMVTRIESWLLQTDLTWTVASVLGFAALLSTVTSTALFIATSNPMLLLVNIPACTATPVLWVLHQRNKRSRKLSTQLPDALDMMVRSLRAGHGIGAGFKLVAEEMPVPVAVEFGRCFEEQNFGIDFRDAVLHMTERVPTNLDLKIFAVSVVIQHETGGNLVEILDNISNTLRERFKFYGKLRALTAEGKISGFILGSLPFICGMLIALINPDYLRPLVEDPMGRGILFGGVTLWALGALWMRGLSRVDV